MQLTVVGCAGSFPSAASPASCYLVEHDGAGILLDLGNGSLGELQDYLDPNDPDALHAVLLSHCHIDHCADLASLYVVRHHHPTRTFAPIPVLGPSDTADRLAGIYGPSFSGTAAAGVFDFRTFGPAPVEVGPFTIEAVPASHPVESYSIRVTAGGASITYSGDTGPNPRLEALAAGTDIALFEASYVGEGHPADLHMSGAEAGRIASMAAAGLLVLTHLVAWNEYEAVLADAQRTFDGPIELARPGLTVSL